jgi:hypothetical protein
MKEMLLAQQQSTDQWAFYQAKERDAKKLEHQRDHHRARDPNFEYAEIFLQIAIVTASVSILAESGGIFFFSLISAVLGVALTANGFVFGWHLPFIGGH